MADAAAASPAAAACIRQTCLFRMMATDRQTGLPNRYGHGVIMSQNRGTAELAAATVKAVGRPAAPVSVTAIDLPDDPLASRAARRQGGRHGRLPRLSGTPALVLLASLIVSLLAASSAPTPLYA